MQKARINNIVESVLTALEHGFVAAMQIVVGAGHQKDAWLSNKITGDEYIRSRRRQ
jgi:hypothetical protein